MAETHETRAANSPESEKELQYWETDLHQFLLPVFKQVPGLTQGDRIDTSAVARRGNVARWTVYRWFRQGIGPKAARTLINVTRTHKHPEGLLTEDQVRTFIAI